MKIITFTKNQLNRLVYFNKIGTPVFIRGSTGISDYSYVYEDRGTHNVVHLVKDSFEVHATYVLWSSSFITDKHE